MGLLKVITLNEIRSVQKYISKMVLNDKLLREYLSMYRDWKTIK